MNLNIRQLEAFVCLVRMGSFSKAASQLNISQAGLSILIKKLEEKLGVKLAERTPRNLNITANGLLLLPIAERILNDSKTILSIGKGGLTDYPSSVSLALTPTLATTLLPDVLKSFHNLYPRVTAVFRECTNERLVAEMHSNEVEFGLGFGMESSKGLDCRSIAEDELVMICAADHALAHKNRVSWADVIHCPVIMSAGSLTRATVNDTLLEIDRALTPIYAPSSLLTAIELARKGLGIAIVSSSVRPALAGTQMVLRTVHDPIIKRDMKVITRSGFTLSEPSQAFIRIFVEALNSVEW
ncbi:LysR family transcriptional regulator [Candidimonas nitroreducens]|nr:LysR family transcriptional regulator [Candidimonas nitroreducens]